MNRPCRVALPWCLAGYYAALRASLADGAKLPERYETWLFSTEQVEREVQRSGVEVVRVTIEPVRSACASGLGLQDVSI
jgi:hypothetical protein